MRARPGRSCPASRNGEFQWCVSLTLVHRSYPAPAKPTAARSKPGFVSPPTHLIPIPSHFPQPPPGFSLSLGPLVVSHAMNGGASSNLSVLDAGVRPKKASSTQRGTSTASYLVLELGRVTVVNQWKRRWSHKSADWRMRACVANIGSQGRVPERREGSGQAHQLQHDGTGPPRQVLHPSHPVPLSL